MHDVGLARTAQLARVTLSRELIAASQQIGIRGRVVTANGFENGCHIGQRHVRENKPLGETYPTWPASPLVTRRTRPGRPARALPAWHLGQQAKRMALGARAGTTGGCVDGA